MSLPLLVRVLRGYRVALAARAADARPCCAATLRGVRADVAAFLEYLTRRKEP